MGIGIYEIRNLINGKVYIGHSKDIRKRFISHKNALNRGSHHNEHLQRAWRKYKDINFSFSVVENCPISELYKRESFFINFYKSSERNFGYNLDVPTGDEAQKIISVRTRQKISIASTGRTHTEETKKKLSLAKMGNPSKSGQIASEETKQKMSQAAMGNSRWVGRKHSEETRKKMSELAKGKNPSQRKKS